MVKKILNEMLAELDANSKVAIGTEKGSAFMYIGTVEGAFNDLHKLLFPQRYIGLKNISQYTERGNSIPQK